MKKSLISGKSNDENWIEYSYWSIDDKTEIHSFDANWIVPPEPKEKKEQLIFLFTGIQHIKGATVFSDHIIQPVLQWGKSSIGGGPYWSIACWYAGTSTIAASKLIRVNVGDKISASIKGAHIPKTPKEYQYTCSIKTDTSEASTLQIIAIPKLTQLVTTLEGYNLNACDQYPNTLKTTFSNIIINGEAIPSKIPWKLSVNYKECGQDIKVIDAASQNGTIDIIYR